jgi:type I restriction enzyme S subunit
MPRTSTASWDSRPLGEVFDMQLGKMLSAATRVGPRQRPYLANRNVQWNRIDLTDVETMHFSVSEDAAYGLKSGDLLVCEGGEIGRTAIWADELDGCHIQNAIHRLRPTDGSIVPRFFLHFMRFAADHGLFRRLSGQTSIAHLTKAGLRQLVIPVPSLSEQAGIAQILDTVDDAIRSTKDLSG